MFDFKAEQEKAARLGLPYQELLMLRLSRCPELTFMGEKSKRSYREAEQLKASLAAEFLDARQRIIQENLGNPARVRRELQGLFNLATQHGILSEKPREREAELGSYAQKYETAMGQHRNPIKKLTSILFG